MKLSILTLLASLAMASTTFAGLNPNPGSKQKNQNTIGENFSNQPNNNTSKASCAHENKQIGIRDNTNLNKNEEKIQKTQNART